MQQRHHLPTPPRSDRDAARSTGRDQGYTLVELIVVILILGLLTTAVIVAVGGMRADAAESRCAADRRTLAVAAEAHQAEDGIDPIPATGVDHDRFERTLVDAGLLRTVSTIHDLDAEGVVRPEGTSPC